MKEPDDRFRLKLSRWSSAGGATLFDSSYGSTILGESMSEITLFLLRPQVYGLAGMDLSFTADTGRDSKAMYRLELFKF